MDYEQLNVYIDNWLDSDRRKTDLYSFIAAHELHLSINKEPLYLYNTECAYICSANQTLHLSKSLLFKIEHLRDVGYEELVLLAPSYTYISRSVKAHVDAVLIYDIPSSYREYMESRARKRRNT